MHSTSDGKLIISREELSGPEAGRRPLAQGATAIYAKRDNSLVPLGRSLYPMENKFLRYKVRYDVSLSEHEYNDVDVSTWLVSTNDALLFNGKISFGFRVHDALEVVRRNIVDGYGRVLSRLRDQVLSISSQFHISDYVTLQREMNRTFGSELALDGGITVYRFSAHLQRNSHALEAGAAVDQAISSIDVVEAQRRLAAARQQADASLELQKMEALQQALNGNFTPLHLVLTRHPDQVLTVLKMMSDSRQASAEQQLDILKHLTENNLIVDVDVAEIREQIIRGVMDVTSQGPTGLHDVLTGQAIQTKSITVSASDNGDGPTIPRQAGGETEVKPRSQS